MQKYSSVRASLNVLHVYRTFFPDTQGGLEETIRQICMTTSNHDVVSKVFTLSNKPEPAVVEVDGIEVHRAKQDIEITSCGMSAHALKIFSNLLAWADVVNYHFPWPFADILHFFSKNKKPSVITYHSDIVRQRALMTIYRPVMNRFLDSVDRIVCTSPNYFATSEVLTNYQSKTEIIPIGIRESSYPTVSEDELSAAEQKWGKDYFLFVGVFRYYKGLHILLEAAKGARYQIVIVGSGPIEAELKAQAADLELDNVMFTGRVSDNDKVALFKNCRAVVFPSYLRTEAFGITLLEGAMFGKPLISTEIGSGTSHVCVHDENGIVVPPGHARSLRQAMDQLFHRPEMASLYGKRSRLRYERLFTGDLMGVRYQELYRDILPKSDMGAANPEQRVNGKHSH